MARNVCVLVVGSSAGKSINHRATISQALKESGGNWQLHMLAVAEHDVAIARTNGWHKLDVVYVVDDFDLRPGELIELVRKLALQLHDDPRKPIVFLSDKLLYLRPFFEDKDVSANYGSMSKFFANRVSVSCVS